MFQTISTFFRQAAVWFLTVIHFLLSFLGIGPKQAWNIRYATAHGQQKVDLYLPRGKDEVALLLHIHGGGWTDGDKRDYRLTCYNVAKSGYPLAAATMNYRMLNGKGASSYTDMLDDIDAALKALKADAAKKGAEIKKVALTGDSAGGHLALLYAYKYAQSAAIPIAFVASNVGPTDLTDMAAFESVNSSWISPLIGKLIGESVSITEDNIAQYTDKLQAASPLYQATASAPPTLLAYGYKDELVPYTNGRNMDAKLTELGVEHEYFEFPNSGHGLSGDSDVSALYSAKLLEYAEAKLLKW